MRRAMSCELLLYEGTSKSGSGSFSLACLCNFYFNDNDLEALLDNPEHLDMPNMSLLRPSIAGRLLRTGGPAARRVVPATVRYDSHTALGTPLTTSDASTAVEAKDPKAIQPRHNQPDYTAEVDQASSYADLPYADLC